MQMLTALVVSVLMLVGGCLSYRHVRVTSPEGVSCYDACIRDRDPDDPDEEDDQKCVAACPSAVKADGECGELDHCVQRGRASAGAVVAIVAVAGLVVLTMMAMALASSVVPNDGY